MTAIGIESITIGVLGASLSASVMFAMVTVGAGMALLVGGLLGRIRARERDLASVLDLPYGERDVDVASVSASYGPLMEQTIGLAGKVVTQIDSKGAMTASLERARLPLRPGELALLTAAGGVIAGTVLIGITGSWLFGLAGPALAPLATGVFIRRRIAKRKAAIEAALPDALSLVASSLSAGHTFLRAIQMMCEEAPPELAEEFGRVVAETRLGDPLVDALGRMAARLDIRDLDWVVQAIRIQQQVGGRLAELLHTLADFIRAREEVRREVAVLTAEGRISAWVLACLAPFMLLVMQIVSPDYLAPLLTGWGLVTLALTAAMVAIGSLIIFKMTRIEV
ncbi:MAG: type II secretion system F family protein [Acidimicrobiales bacterium]